MRARSRPSPRAFKAKPTSFDKDDSFRLEVVPPERDFGAAGARLTHKVQCRVGQANEVYGDRVMSKGEHRFVVTIEETHSPAGTGLIFGVASANASESYGRRKYGVRVSDGRFIQLPVPQLDFRELRNASEEERRPPSARLLAEGHHGAARSMRAVAHRVEIICDMDRRRLAFSVDGATAVDSGIMPEDLPEALVPWVQVFFKGDVVTLEQHRSRLTGASPPHSPPPVLVPPPSKVYDQTPFEAGPWTP